MAIDMSGESSSPLTSPRISFSYDLHHQPDDDPEDNPYRESRDSSSSSLLDKCFDDDDFGFCINSNCIATAEDLFLDGKIRSLQLQDKFTISKHQSSLPILESHHHSFPIPIPPIGISNPDCSDETTQPPENLDTEKSSNNNNQSKYIKRSSSLHCDNTHRKSSFWFSLPLLSRSNSTGSVPKAVKENQNHKSKNLKNSADLMPSSYRKPPLRKHYVGYNKGNGMRINPVLNVPPPKITSNLFGFGAIFGSGDKVKKIKK